MASAGGSWKSGKFSAKGGAKEPVSPLDRLQSAIANPDRTLTEREYNQYKRENKAVSPLSTPEQMAGFIDATRKVQGPHFENWSMVRVGDRVQMFEPKASRQPRQPRQIDMNNEWNQLMSFTLSRRRS